MNKIKIEHGTIPSSGDKIFFIFPTINIIRFNENFLYKWALVFIWGSWYIGIKWHYQS